MNRSSPQRCVLLHFGSDDIDDEEDDKWIRQLPGNRLARLFAYHAACRKTRTYFDHTSRVTALQHISKPATAAVVLNAAMYLCFAVISIEKS